MTNQEQNMTLGDIAGELAVEKLGHGGLLVALNQNLADSNFAAALLQCLFHAFSSTHDTGMTDQ